MSRKPDDKIREEILERVLLALSQNGLNNLSLRDIAREVGVSARMLIYHFETYEELINTVFIHLSLKHKNLFNKFLSENSDKSLGQVLQIFIETIFIEQNKNSLLLFTELYLKALRDIKKYNAFLNEVLHNWINEGEIIIADKYGKNSRIYATMIVSFYRGLMLDWLAVDDNKRIIETSRTFTDLINSLMKEASG